LNAGGRVGSGGTDEVERSGDGVGCGIALIEWWKAPLIFCVMQDAGVIEHSVDDTFGRHGGDENGGNPGTVLVERILGGLRIGRHGGGGHDVILEATVLVVGEDEKTLVPHG